MLPTLVRPARGYLTKPWCTVSTLSAEGLRALSSSSSVVDQMLQYVWSDLKGQGQPAIDVLRSGLSMQPDPHSGVDSARLHVALSEVFAAENNWAEAASSSQAAAAAAAAADSSLSGLASFQATRALLVTGRDREAITWASSSSSNGSSNSAIYSAQQLMVHYASGAATSHLQQQLHAQLEQYTSNSSSSNRVQSVITAISNKVAGDMALAQGSYDAAASSYQAAKQALGAAAGSSDSDSSSSSSSSFSPDESSGLSSRFFHEVAADVAVGAAQVHMFQKQWDASEEQLSSALKSAEAAGGESSPMLAAVLLLLASGYSRQARVMFAEGMCREAAKILGATEPNRLVDRFSSSSSSHQAVHPSLAAAVAWRYCQLLTALPNRTGEAVAWGAAAKQLWSRSGFGAYNSQSNSQNNGQDNVTVESYLGDDVALKGQGGHGRGVVVSLMLRRLLPVVTDSSTKHHR